MRRVVSYDTIIVMEVYIVNWSNYFIREVTLVIMCITLLSQPSSLSLACRVAGPLAGWGAGYHLLSPQESCPVIISPDSSCISPPHLPVREASNWDLVISLDTFMRRAGLTLPGQIRFITQWLRQTLFYFTTSKKFLFKKFSTALNSPGLYRGGDLCLSLSSGW